MDGSTRIVGIWDQTIEGQGIETGDIVQDIRYGTSYTEEQINEALNSVEPLSIVPSVDTIGHGTFMAMVAAGMKCRPPISRVPPPNRNWRL